MERISLLRLCTHRFLPNLKRLRAPYPIVDRLHEVAAKAKKILGEFFAIDLTTCPQCGSPLTLLAAIEDPSVIVKILSHLGLPTRAPPRASARLDKFLQTA